MFSNLRIRTKSIIVGITLVLVSVAITTLVSLSLVRSELTRQANEFQNVKMRVFRDLLQQKGEPKLVDGKLFFGDHLMNDNFEIVDKMKNLTGGTATVFQGDVRVSTNVLKEDGSRAVGTPLVGAAKELTLDRGQSFRGEAEILGVPYFTAYDPILDSHGRALGVLYVGVKEEDFFRSFRQLRMTAILLGCGLGVTFGLVVYFAMGALLKRLSALAAAADAVSMGNQLDVPLVSESTDEIGELAKAIDRLRVSMREALKRLVA